MDEHLVADVALNATSLLDHLIQLTNFRFYKVALIQLLASTFIVSIVSINHIDKCTTVLNVLCRVAFEDKVTREVNDRELDVVIVADGLSFNCTGWEQEESLMG